MHTRSLVLPALLAAAAPLQAQTPEFGVKGGVLASAYHDAQLPANHRINGRPGPVAGAWLRQPLSPRVALQAELLYESRGARFQSEGVLGWEGSLGYYEHEEKSRLHYLTLPVLVRVRFGKVFAEAGPQLSYLTAGRNALQTRDYVRNSGAYEYLLHSASESTADFRRWEAGYAAGLGLALTPALSVGLRYAGALTSLYPAPVFGPARPIPRAYADHYNLTRARNAALQVQVSYRLRGGA
ncbi:porin family protein [Hymenobacter edaphi]|uniref:Outer membrane protein beta-barrel domain-containing protein n=1 Tax=Hymenobacter edaphi TaxID=2211146 RepID=A0A328B738_9BACT|nr:porin family protein [Hymenobacter edaphi]RAK62689.1 hypothetical protein DLM85_22740 [Hymenobacter edaphi]